MLKFLKYFLFIFNIINCNYLMFDLYIVEYKPEQKEPIITWPDDDNNESKIRYIISVIIGVSIFDSNLSEGEIVTLTCLLYAYPHLYDLLINLHWSPYQIFFFIALLMRFIYRNCKTPIKDSEYEGESDFDF